MGKQRKKENYWDSEEADKDHANLQKKDDESDSEEDVPVAKSKGKQQAAGKKQNGGKKSKEESSSEEEVVSKPTPSKAKKPAAKKGSVAKKMLESDSGSEESESEEEAPKKPAPAKGKKAAAAPKMLPPSDDSESEESESESEEEAPKKPAPAKGKKAAPAAKKSVAKMMLESDSGSEESESSESEEEAPKKPAPAKGKKAAAAPKILPPSDDSESEESESEEEAPKKPAPAKGKKAAAVSLLAPPSDDSESEQSESSSEEEKPAAKQAAKPAAKQAAKPAAKPAAKQAAKPAPAPAKKAAAATKESGSGSGSESEEEGAEKKTETTAATAAPSAAAKKKKNKKKPGAQEKKPAAPQEEKISSFLLKQRQEAERKQKEEEERKRKAEEDARLAAIKQKEDEERARIKSAEKAKKKAERKLIEDEEKKERERIERIEKLKASGVKVAALENPQAAGEAKKVVYAKKKNANKKDQVNQLSEQVGQIKIEEPTTPTEPSSPQEEVMESWDADGWESMEDIQARKEEEEKKRLEEEEKKKQEEKEAAKAEKKGKKGKDGKPTTSTTSTGANGDESNQETQAEKELRSPILCILGHVDTGKTSLLDKIRSTNVQGGEARGITQQIGASFVPVDTIKEQTKGISDKLKVEFKLPGLLLIDTPGHESFNNLRSRGSGLCDLAILVIDIMHGIEKQTIESINLLRMRKTPFVVALNKIDRIYEWQKYVNVEMKEELKLQSRHTQQDFESKVNKVIAQLAEHELNAQLYWRNKDFKKVVSLVPTSAVTGEGLADLMLVVVQLMQKIMAEKVTYRNTLECTILEVKAIEGLGTTIDAVLVNGVLNEGDKIVVSGFGGPIVTTIRSLLTPPPLRETRVKTALIPNKSVRASMGIKIVAPGLDQAVAGTSLYVVNEDNDVEDLKREAQKEVDSVLSADDTEEIGVAIQASTLGSLEAFSSFLKGEKIPVAFKAIGPVHKKHVMNAAIMANKDPKYALLLAFGVKVEETAQQAANELKIQIMSEETIYLFVDRLKKYFDTIKERLREQSAGVCVWPVLLDVISVFRKKDPILVGVRIKEGTLRIGTPITVPDAAQQHADVGVIQSIKKDDKDVTIAKKDDEVSIAIDDSNTKTTFGRHFDDKKPWYSKISRESIDALKAGWSDELTKQDKQLIQHMKQVFKIN